MNTLLSAFANGGPGMIPTAIFGLVLVAVSVKYAAKPEKRFVPLMISTGVLTLLAGGFGFVSGVIKSINAVAETNADARLSLLGTGESLNNVALALGLAAAAAVAASIGALRLASKNAV